MASSFAGFPIQVQQGNRLRCCLAQPRKSRHSRATEHRQIHAKSQTYIAFCQSYSDAEKVMISRIQKQLYGEDSPGKKLIIGLAGIPGSGKTTCAANVMTKLNESEEIAVMVPMDGFHFYRCDLDQMPNPALAHERRGAAFTINAPVFINCLRRLLDESQTAHPIPFPSFDHAVGDPIQDDVIVKPEHKVVLVEGLYLLRDEQPWGDLDEILDDKWLLRADVDIAMGNVVARQVGMGAHEADVRCRVNANDRVNADEVYSICRRPDCVIDISVAAQKEGAHEST